jgi:hypothetical protein
LGLSYGIPFLSAVYFPPDDELFKVLLFTVQIAPTFPAQTGG